MRPLAVLLVCSCAPEVRFADRGILWVEHDDAPIPLPAEQDSLLVGPGVRDELFGSADRVLRLDFGREAGNVNALDEVPDSSWFADPRGPGGTRALSDEEMVRGADGDEEPPQPPFTILRAKTEGATVGFIVSDARRRQLLLKLDPPGWVGLATSTEVVATRLVWAAGWRVPRFWLVDVHPDQLRRAPDAMTKNEWRRPVPLDDVKLHEMLARAPRQADGTLRAAMSEWIGGIILGPYRYFGRRRDDANDRVPHQDRRDLRGFSVLSSWLNNIDTQEQNTLDSYVGELGRGHVVHYQQDVGGSFGSRAVGPTDYWMGTESYFQTSRVLWSLLTLGLDPRPWEGERVRRARAQWIARYPELGWFDAQHFDPRGWHPMVHNPAFDLATARDRYWGAKRVVAISARELRAAISVGNYRPEAREQLFAILWARRARLARAWLGDLPALDHFRVERGRLCFDDLWLDAGLGGEAATQYFADSALLDGRCGKLSQAHYGVVALRVKRPGQRRASAPVRVHLIDGRIVGVER
jgi:hypothetical protein